MTVKKFSGDTLTRVKDYGDGSHLPLMGAGNILFKRRDACEVYPAPDVWEDSIADGDFILPRGNTAGAGWIEISKSPWNRDTETVLGFKDVFEMPFRLFSQITLTHRVAGQMIASLNAESEDELAGLVALPDPTPTPILNASQATTIITVNFDPNNLPAVPYRIGQPVSIYGFVDNRLNVSNGTVATTPSDTQITVVGNDYAFTSGTINTTLGNGAAFITRREMLGNARNAVGVVHGSATVTQRRIYTRSQGGVSRPSGTIAGSHHLTTATDAATAAAAAPRADAWVPGQEQNLLVSRDHVTLLDRAVDGNAGWTSRYRQTQVVPNPARPYKAKKRVRSTPGLCNLVAKIVSISKAGSATATIELDRPHNLVVGNYVGFYGVRDQTNFANAAAGLIVTAVPTPTSIQLAHGSSATATSWGGFVWLAQGQQALGGAVAQVAQSVTRVNGIVTITGSANWAAPIAIGNLFEAVGLRAETTGADLGLDGVYNVINFSTNQLVLEPVLGLGAGISPATGGDIGATNCGGGIVQRFGVRLHVLMVLDYEPLLMEFAFKGNADAGEAAGVQIIGTPAVTMTSTTVAGTVAVDAAIGNPVTAGLRASNANIAAMSAAGDNVAWLGTMIGVGVTRPYALPEASWNASVALTTTTAVALQTAAGAGLKRHMTAGQAINTGAGSVDLIILDGTTERWRLPLPVNVPVPLVFPTELVVTANTALNASLSASGTVRINAQGHTSP